MNTPISETPKKNNNRIWITCGVAALVIICLGSAAALGGFYAFGSLAADSSPAPTEEVLPTETIEPTPTEEITQNNLIPFEAVVQIQAMYEEYDSLKLGWTGSGTIISPDGYILTNAHVVLASEQFPVDALGVALTFQDDQPPVLTYYAEVLQANERLDIAVIKITTDSNGHDVNGEDLDLPYVPYGDADTLKLGDPIIIMGYPGIGGTTITLTRGEVGGFTSEDEFGDRAFIKTSAAIAGGNSGGLAADSEGRIIGVPTQLGYGGDDQFVDCRVLADTNRDGRIDGNDSCVPTGGFINALRPINLAIPLIDAARKGQVAIVEADAPKVDLPEQGPIIFEDDFSDPNYGGWGTSGDNEYFVGHSDSEYHIEVIKDNLLAWARTHDYYEDTVVNVDVHSVVSVGNADYGVICRYQDQDNFYALEISEDGYYVIWKIVDGEYEILVDWRRSSHVPRDESYKTLTVACVGDRLSIGVNGQFLVEARDSTFSGGDIGMIVGTFDTGGVTMGFDNFVVREPLP